MKTFTDIFNSNLDIAIEYNRKILSYLQYLKQELEYITLDGMTTDEMIDLYEEVMIKVPEGGAREEVDEIYNDILASSDEEKRKQDIKDEDEKAKLN